MRPLLSTLKALLSLLSRPIAGTIDDYIYVRRMRDGKVPYRPPRWLKCRGWRTPTKEDMTDPEIEFGDFLDTRINQLVTLVRTQPHSNTTHPTSS